VWDGKESNSVAIFSLTMTGIAWLVVGLRFYARLKLTTFGVDDWAVIPATVLILFTSLPHASGMVGLFRGGSDEVDLTRKIGSSDC
jgi:hypothetical protein